MISNRINTRFEASLAHLLFSAIVALFVLALVFKIWYPGLLAAATGVDEIFFIVLGVDVCLGPLLTFAVFNRKKKELKRDLFIIFTLQIGALIYGLYTVGIVRPVYVVFEIDRFQLIYANDLDDEKLKAASRDEYKSLPYFGPKWISSKFPENIEEKNKFIFSTVEGGDDLAKTPKYYVPYNESKSNISEKIQPLEMLKDFNPNKIDDYNNLINKYSTEPSQFGFLPLKGFVMDLTVVLDKNTSEVLEISELRPWGE
jgi:hypothetical protein